MSIADDDIAAGNWRGRAIKAEAEIERLWAALKAMKTLLRLTEGELVSLLDEQIEECAQVAEQSYEKGNYGMTVVAAIRALKGKP